MSSQRYFNFFAFNSFSLNSLNKPQLLNMQPSWETNGTAATEDNKLNPDLRVS